MDGRCGEGRPAIPPLLTNKSTIMFCLKGITMASPYRTGPAAKLRIRTYAITDYSYGTSPQTANMVQTQVQRYGLRKQKYVAMFLNVGRFSAFLPVSRYRPP